MSTSDRTVNIGIETAANALRKFLISGDSPVDCTVILSTINTELQSIKSPQAVQVIVQGFLDSDLLSSASKVWNQERIPKDLELEISNLFHLVTNSIFEGCGDLTSGLQYRESHSNKLVTSFFHELYKEALQTEVPRLAYTDNIAISSKLVGCLRANPNFVASFFDNFGEFPPYTFFVRHIPLFFIQVAKCLNSCNNDRYLKGYIKQHLATLIQKVTWGDIAVLWDKENAWKLLFFCEVLQETPVVDSVMLVFESFLHSIDSWKVLFEVNLYFLNMVPRNPLIDSVIAESSDTRMVLIMRNAKEETLLEQEQLIIWDYICKVLECNSFDLIIGLFYDISVPYEEKSQELIIKEFRKNTYKLMASDPWFVDTFTNYFPNFCKLSLSSQHCNVEWSSTKSLSSFYMSGISNFLTNSLIVNRFLYSSTLHLLRFDCSEIVALPSAIIDEVGRLLGSVDRYKFKETRTSIGDSVGLGSELKRYPELSTGATSENTESLTDTQKLICKNEGIRQNFFLLEAIAATVYAGMKAKNIGKGVKNGGFKGLMGVVESVYNPPSSEGGQSLIVNLQDE